MDFTIKTLDSKNPFPKIKTDCLVLGIYEDKKLSTEAEILNHDGVLTPFLKSNDITGKLGSSLLLYDIKEINAKRVLLIGLGKKESFSEKSFKDAFQTLSKTILNLGAAHICIALSFNDILKRDACWAIQNGVLLLREALYRCDSLKSKVEKPHYFVKEISFASDNKDSKQALTNAIAMADGIDLTKELGNLPANYCTPTHLANTAKKIAKEHQLKVEILERKQLEALKMGSFLSVTNGSAEPPKLIVLKHFGTNVKTAPIVLVGKGITFDSGGISLKPGLGMDEMKYDMCGAASVLGTLLTVAKLKLKLNVIGIIPTCENMPSGQATRPGDIVTSMSGQTIEILNTDAEGRLILCDALTYAERLKPKAVIDIATLTGACVTALGNHNAGLFTRHDEKHDALANALLEAGINSGDTVWRMPIQDAYQEQLRSNFADIANIGGPTAGAITAACFLERFTKAYTWAHLDIAGVAWKSGASKGATGRPVPLLTTFLLNQV